MPETTAAMARVRIVRIPSRSPPLYGFHGRDRQQDVTDDAPRSWMRGTTSIENGHGQHVSADRWARLGRVAHDPDGTDPADPR
jgi:hypothetical protein